MNAKRHTKCFLKATLLVDHEDCRTEVRAPIVLVRDTASGEYVWKIGGPLGDEVEVLPLAFTVRQAQADFRISYLKDGPFKPKASWL